MPFAGLRDTTDWPANTRPESWREMILYLYPNGRAPLTAITSQIASERVSDPHYHWFLKDFPEQSDDVDRVWQSTSLSTPKTAQQNEGSTFAVEFTNQSAWEEFRVGHTALVTVKGDYRYNTKAEVTAVDSSGSDYYVELTLLHDEDATYFIDDNDSNLWIEVIGSAHEEGATMPEAVSYDEREGDNYTQIFRTPLKITRTAKQTRFRSTGGMAERKQEMKAEALDLHAVEMERAFLWGEKRVDTSGSEPKRFTRGTITALQEEGPAANVDNFQFNSNFSGDTWLEGGKEWLNERLEIIHRKGAPRKMGFIGSRALLGLQQLAEAYSDFNIDEQTNEFGIELVRWRTSFGVIELRTHPLFSMSDAHRNKMFLLEPSRLRFRFVQDTMYKTDESESKVTNDSRDSDEEEFLTEAGLEYGHLATMGLFGGVGADNSV